MTKQVSLEIRGELDALHLIWTLLGQVMEAIPQARPLQQECYNTLVAVQEGATNVIRHAYGGILDRPFRVEILVEGPRLQVSLVDVGPPFDPTQVEVFPKEERPEEGGYGIYFMRTVMNEIRYARVGETNVLTMVKDFSLHPVPAGPPGEDGA